MATSIFKSVNSNTFDQSAIPTNPFNGATWRERDSSNNVVQEWFWNGTYWLSIDKKVLRSNGGADISNSGWIFNATIQSTSIDELPPHSIFIEKLGVQFKAQSGTLTNGDWVFTFGSYANIFSDTPSIFISNNNKYSAGGYDFINQYVSYNKFFQYNSLFRLDIYGTKSSTATAMATTVYAVIGICRVAR